MSHLAIMQILGPETCKQMIRDADAEWENENGLFAEDANVVAEDRQWKATYRLGEACPHCGARDYEPHLDRCFDKAGPYFADVPFPNPVSQEDGS